MDFSFIKRHLTSNFEAPNVDLSGRTCLVTGTTVGTLGYEAALHYARKNPARLILASRSQAKGDAAIAAIQRTLPDFKGRIEFWSLDMSSFDSVRAFSDRLQELDRLDAIVLNAGVAHFSWVETDEGYEDTLQINVISTGLIALRALPVLSKTADLLGDKTLKPHLVIVASEVHEWAKLAQQDQPNIIEALNKKEKATVQDTYNISKLLDVFMAREIAKLSAASKVIVTSVNPGLCKSELRDDLPRPIAALFNWIAWSTEFGARNFLYAGVADVTSGAYVSNCQETQPAAFVTSEKGTKIQKQTFSELSSIWRTIDPKVDSLLA